MFKHQGKDRTLKHNLRIATVLSFVAGIVNVTGFLAFKQLATHVTGHFSHIINDVLKFEFSSASTFLLYILSFLLGSFTTGYLVEKHRTNKHLNIFLIPTIIESIILISVGMSGSFMIITYPNIIICLLLFVMGLQNSLVTKISNAVVRTTHLTGLFTDLGIDLSKLFFPKSQTTRRKLKANIILRLAIILFFFTGGIVGGILYSKFNLKLHTLIFAAFIILLSLFFDDFRYRFLKLKKGRFQNN